jgi:hypothetical protein
MQINDSTVQDGWSQASIDEKSGGRILAKLPQLASANPKKQILDDRSNVLDIDCDSRKVAFPHAF